jgi:hypothetical protein
LQPGHCLFVKTAKQKKTLNSRVTDSWQDEYIGR